MRLIRGRYPAVPSEYHDLSSSGGAVQAVEEATAALEAVARLATAEDADTAVLATVADLSYAWLLVDQYTTVMQVLCTWCYWWTSTRL